MLLCVIQNLNVTYMLFQVGEVVMTTSSLLVKRVLEMGMCDVIVRCSPDCVAAFADLHSPVFLTVCESTVRPRPGNKASVCE